MKVELLELKENRVRFLLKGVSAAFANGIRRAALAEVPNLAIDEIALYDNTSVLFDEQLALRLGLVPITAEDPSVFSLPEECQCGGAGCPGCRLDFMVTVEGPGMVYSRDIKFTDPSVRPVVDTIPLVVLGEGEKVVIEGYATLGVARSHAKWNAGTLCGYKNLPKIEIGPECNGCGKCIAECARNILVLEAERIKVTDPLNCSLCKLCVRACETGAVKVEPVLDCFVLSIEGDGSVKARDMVWMATSEIRKRAEYLGNWLAEFA
ncbi:MAG: DNA-directed RNA polymerase subunit D [Methanosaeta sp. PtaB.Bin039]|nr:MAG: DNA-directed RNA polymerase subunit D [Methanosaeta sp. PtaB.Bin039]OPY45859.1 MAG: DNA-directed RNA polymerase subunit D [Methanosaeta sp. PtaU1.Bin028]HOT07811.1 DNA-directed RNA polymerase subunit D [Methanotrichaceae archaeon]HQF17556.1 DNA-directed RNA polymerase subunit D [Methanotrichaceae archaeon]HQI92102.1 DNA-directed RNA polymerase subunit D [Methanotrichaceae archaeon]